MTYRELLETQLTEQDILDMITVNAYFDGPEMNESFESLSKSVRTKINFIKDLSKKAKMKIDDVLKLFEDTKVLKFFKMISFNMKKFFNMVHKGFVAYETLQRVISKYVSDSKIGRFTEANLKDLDVYIKKHPILTKMSGVAVAGILLFIWTRMSFTGNFDYDFDWSNIFDALRGNFNIHELFAGVEGTRLLMLFGTGVLTGLSFPWVGSMGTKFVIATLVGLKHLSKH